MKNKKVSLIFSEIELNYLHNLLLREIKNNPKCQNCQFNSDNGCYFAISCLSGNIKKEED